MIKVIDVDYISNFKLALAFNDGFEGIVDLEALFSRDPFKQFAERFECFSFTQNTLCWNGECLNPEYLREIAQYQPTNNTYLDPHDILAVLTQAFRDSLEEDDPAILQAALRGYAQELGMSAVVKQAGIKSRPSAYKSLSDNGSPKWESIVKLAHSIIELSKAPQDSVVTK